MYISSEQLAYWYLRLNGFLTISNFVIHPDMGSNQRTDVDVMGVRFPYRSELLLNSMQDDGILNELQKDKILIVLAEVKQNRCEFNNTWITPEKENMQRALRAIGSFPLDKIDLAASELYKHGFYETQLYHVSLLSLGARTSRVITRDYPKVPQITWLQTLTFIYERFQTYRQQKASHGQWDASGKALWSQMEQSTSLEEFVDRVEIKS